MINGDNSVLCRQSILPLFCCFRKHWLVHKLALHNVCDCLLICIFWCCVAREANPAPKVRKQTTHMCDEITPLQQVKTCHGQQALDPLILVLICPDTCGSSNGNNEWCSLINGRDCLRLKKLYSHGFQCETLHTLIMTRLKALHDYFHHVRLKFLVFVLLWFSQSMHTLGFSFQAGLSPHVVAGLCTHFEFHFVCVIPG